ncbi:hypothetical protein B0T22DRAFT_211244 [Podospora appendiculata]|uniref:Uncharacterized protein n=1 Tax=Podospora appendiculata TaxID=314037 RepID=A0AAE0X4L5_9PEZI|nr:hypothetical protein B0T22DRAFT_211244 [Podospora appendiculata]
MVNQHTSPFKINLLNGLEAEEHAGPSSSSHGVFSAAAAPAAAAPPLEKQFSPASANLSTLLPASRRTKDDDIKASTLDLEYLREELCTKRLDVILNRLWMVGRPMPPRPLHYQRLLSREVFVTERMDMHLVWTEGRIFVKPIPRLLLATEFWTDYLACDQACCAPVPRWGTGFSQPAQPKWPASPPRPECDRRRIRRSCLGFLFSYTALIAYESDFKEAKNLHLVPREVKWSAWRIFVRELLDETEGKIYQKVSKRFLYGELRLSRLNKIYIFARRVPRGYMNRWSRYSGFFKENLTWLASVVGYVAIILTALQVGLTTKSLPENDSFQTFSTGFTIFSLVGPIGVLLLLIVYFLAVFTANWLATESFEKQRMDMMHIDSLTEE